MVQEFFEPKVLLEWLRMLLMVEFTMDISKAKKELGIHIIFYEERILTYRIYKVMNNKMSVMTINGGV